MHGVLHDLRLGQGAEGAQEELRPTCSCRRRPAAGAASVTGKGEAVEGRYGDQLQQDQAMEYACVEGRGLRSCDQLCRPASGSRHDRNIRQRGGGG